MSKLLDYALWYLRHGFSVIPLDGKEPKIKWKEYATRLPTEEEVRQWFTDGVTGIGIICGSVSGGREGQALVVIDFDSPEVYEKIIKEIPVFEYTLRVKTGRGYHVYLVVPAQCAKNMKLKGGIEVRAERQYVVAPPSKHPSGSYYKFIPERVDTSYDPRSFIYELNDCKIFEILEEEVTKLFGEPQIDIETAVKRAAPGAAIVFADCKTWMTWNEEEINAAVELVKKYYREGYRNDLSMALFGWFRKYCVAKESAVAFITKLANETGDNELESKRLPLLERTYELRIDPPDVKTLLGKGGVKDVLARQGVAKEEIDAFIEELGKIVEKIRHVKKWHEGHVIYSILNEGMGIYAINDMNKLIMARARRTKQGFFRMERVAETAITRVVEYINPVTGFTRFEVTVERRMSDGNIHKLTIGPLFQKEVVNRVLEFEGVVKNSRMFQDVFIAVMRSMIYTPFGETKLEVETPGIFLVDGKLRVIKYDTTPPTPEELAAALDLLDKLAGWYKHVLNKFATVVKWAMEAAFYYVKKKMGQQPKWLYLFGAAGTGKTTLGKIPLAIWGVYHNDIGPGNVDNPARMGHYMSQSTFPVLLNEPKGILNDDVLVEMIKNAVTGDKARGKYTFGTYVEYPALAPFTITSNYVYPKDDALRRRFYVVHFTFKDKLPEKIQEEFGRTMMRKIMENSPLAALGRFAVNEVLKEPELLELPQFKLGEELLKRAYRAIGREPPKWVEMIYEEEKEDPLSEAYISYIERLRQITVELHTKHFKVNETDVGEMLEELLKANKMPGCHYVMKTKKTGEGEPTVVILKPHLENMEIDITLQQLAEVLGGKVKNIYLGGGRKSKLQVWGVVVPLEKLKNAVRLIDTPQPRDRNEEEREERYERRRGRRYEKREHEDVEWWGLKTYK
ncbi:MAG: bifunctional DNA primase/polymerase [Pyrobaculum sp.]